MAMKMNRNASRGPLYTEYGVSIRCMRRDLTTQSVTLHYLSNGTCTLRFVIRKQEFLVPVVILLKVRAPTPPYHVARSSSLVVAHDRHPANQAMTDTTDREIYEKMTHGSNVPFVSDRVELMLRDAKVLPQCHHPARSLSLSRISVHVLIVRFLGITHACSRTRSLLATSASHTSVLDSASP